MSATRLHPLGFRREGNPFVHYLNIKRSDASGRQGTEAQTGLFVCGLPLSFQEADLFQLFSCFGAVEQAVLHPSKRSAMLVFSSPSAVTACLNAAREAQLVELPAISQEQPNDAPSGLKAWVVAHKAARPGNEQLQVQLDVWTESHEAAEAERVRAQQAAMGEDGWTVVVRSKGRKRTREEGGVTSQSGGVAPAAAQAMAASRQQAPLENFYNFQRREKRRNELVDLRQRFDEDRKRIQNLRAVRNFKPV